MNGKQTAYNFIAFKQDQQENLLLFTDVLNRHTHTYTYLDLMRIWKHTHTQTYIILKILDTFSWIQLLFVPQLLIICAYSYMYVCEIYI